MKLVLASSSKWRRALFKTYLPDQYKADEVNFAAPDVDEKAVPRAPKDTAADLALRIATAKLEAVCGIYNDRDEDFVVLVMDQVISIEGHIREKPTSAVELRSFVESYSGREVVCSTGVLALHPASGRRSRGVDTARMTFAKLTRQHVESYLKEFSSEAMTAAGGFSIDRQHALAMRVRKLSGSAASVEGFPVMLALRLVAEVLPMKLAPEIKPICVAKMAIFDMDGLILDTERLYTVAQERLLAEIGLTFTKEVKALMMGRKKEEAVAVMAQYYGVCDTLDQQDFIKRREDILDALFPECELLPGAERLLRHLSQHGVPMALATSSNRRHYNMKTSRHVELFSLFKVVLTGDDVLRGKPHPDIFLKALEMLAPGAEPSSAIVFEDSPLGVQAAKRAGMTAVQVADDAGNENRPDLFLRTLWTLLPEQIGFKSFEDQYESQFLK